MVYLTKVQINSITIKDDSSGTDPNVLFEWEYERKSGSEISEFTMETTTAVNSLVTLTVGQTIEIWAGWTTSTDKKIFSGYISSFSPEAGKIKFVCKDKMWDLIRNNVNKVYEESGTQAGVISAIAKDLIETWGGLTADVQTTGSATGETIAEFRCTSTDIWERLVALANAVNYIIYYDAVNDTVHFEQGGLTDSGVTLTVGSNITAVPSWINDTSRMVNDLRVDGAVSNTQIRLPFPTGTGQIATTTNFDTTGIVLDKTPESVELLMDAANPPVTTKQGGTKDASSDHFYYVDKQNKTIVPATGTTFTTDHYAIVNYTWLAPAPIHQTNPESIATYGKWEQTTTLSDIQSISDAEARTSQILAHFSVPFLLGELLVDNTADPGIELGDKVLVIDEVSSPNINKEFVITSQILSYPGTTQEVIVGDESIKLADWQLDVETRLKRIEELLSLQNQDLILELYDFSNNIQVEPRYRKIQYKNVAGESLIYGSTDFGIFGTAKWGSVAKTSFILGGALTSVLGTSLLGSLSSEDVDHYIEQYLDTYTEEFIDEDFLDTTSGTWGSGSLIL